MNKRLRQNIPILYAHSFCWLALMVMPILVPLFADRGLSLTQVFYLQSIFAGFVVLLEVPSGYIADIYGRRLALLVGSAFHGAAFTWLVFADGFIALVLFELLAAVAISLLSGADLSLLYDSQSALDMEPDEKARGIASMRFAKSIAEGIAALAGGMLLMVSFDAVVLANAAVAWLPLLLGFFLVEAPFQRMSAATPLANVREVVRHLFVRDRLLRLICINMTFFGLITFYVVWLLQPYWQDQGVDLRYFGLLWAAQSFLFAIVVAFALRLERRFGAPLVLGAMAVLPILGYVAMATVGGLLGIVMSFCFFVSRGLNQVILTDALNRRVPGQFRATANSMTSFTFRAVFIVTGPLLGILVGGVGMYWSLALLGVLALLLIPCCLLPLLAAIRQAETEGRAATPPVASAQPACPG